MKFNEKTRDFLTVFFTAFAIRLSYLISIKGLPFFSYPLGDSAVYYQRALEILSGSLAGRQTPFLGSVLYPYFMAAALFFSGKNLLLVYLIQITLGSLTCYLIYELSRTVAEHRSTALLAGMTAAIYGPFVFFDADLLMISITLTSITGGLLLLIGSLKTGSYKKAFGSGLLLALAGLDRANLLLFLPVAVLLLYGSPNAKAVRLKIAGAFLAAAVFLLLPVSAVNSIGAGEFSLTGSNMGVNLYIGNNPQAKGVFLLPEDSGLSNHDLFRSSKAVAEKETGRALTASQVSGYWLKKGLSYALSHPLQEAGLLLLKTRLFYNHYEIPNHFNFYFIRKQYAPILNAAFLGFWLVGPLALAGIFWVLLKGPSLPEKVCLSFAAVCLVSLLPFFIADRYRLPIVPVMIVLAVGFLRTVAEGIKGRHYRSLILAAASLAVAAWLVNFTVLKFNYCSDRIETSRAYLERAMAQNQPEGQDVMKAAVGLKWALEASQPADPWKPSGHFHLARTYAYMGYYSGAVAEFEKARDIGGQGVPVEDAIRQVKREYERTGDVISQGSIPATPLEKADRLFRSGDDGGAIAAYEKLLAMDPFHFLAYNNLGLVYYSLGRYRDALKVLNRSKAYLPDNEVITQNICHIYRQMGQGEKADKIWQKHLKKINRNL